MYLNGRIHNTKYLKYANIPELAAHLGNITIRLTIYTTNFNQIKIFDCSNITGLVMFAELLNNS